MSFHYSSTDGGIKRITFLAGENTLQSAMIYPNYLDRQISSNSVHQDQRGCKMQCPISVYIVCHSSSSLKKKLTGSKMYLLKLQDKYGKG